MLYVCTILQLIVSKVYINFGIANPHIAVILFYSLNSVFRIIIIVVVVVVAIIIIIIIIIIGYNVLIIAHNSFFLSH